LVEKLKLAEMTSMLTPTEVSTPKLRELAWVQPEVIVCSLVTLKST
jgi:hypothetical protein